MNLRLWLGMGSVAALLAFGVWRDVTRSSHVDAAALEETVVTLGTVSKRVTLAGMIWPQKRASVWPQTPGRVTKLLVSRGELVKQGQPLAELDPWNAQREVERRRLAVLRARLRLNRPLTAPVDGASESDLTTEQIDLQQSELELKSAERDLANTVVRSPMNGTAIHVGVREGDVVTMGGGAPPFLIADTSKFSVEVEGDEFEAAGVVAGSQVTVFVESVRVAPMIGVVQENAVLKRLAQGVSQGSVFGFSVAIEGVDLPLQLGMVATVEIEIRRRDNVRIVPLAAVSREGDVDVLYVRTSRGVARTPVTLGLSDMFVVELLSGPDLKSTIVYRASGTGTALGGATKN